MEKQEILDKISKQKMPKKSIPTRDEELTRRITAPPNKYSQTSIIKKVADKKNDLRPKDISRKTPAANVHNVVKSSKLPRIATQRQARIDISTDSSSSTLSPKPNPQVNLKTNQPAPRSQQARPREFQPNPIPKSLSRFPHNKSETKIKTKPIPNIIETENSSAKNINSCKNHRIPSNNIKTDVKVNILKNPQTQNQNTLKVPIVGPESSDKRPSLASITKMPNFGGSGFTDSLDLDKLGGDLFQADDFPEISNELLRRDYRNYFTKWSLSRQKSSQDALTISDEEDFSLPNGQEKSLEKGPEGQLNGHRSNEQDTDIDVPPIPYEKTSVSNVANGIKKPDFEKSSPKNSSNNFLESNENAKIYEKSSSSESSTKVINGKLSSSEDPEIFISSSSDNGKAKTSSQKSSSSHKTNSSTKVDKSNSNSDSSTKININSQPSSSNDEKNSKNQYNVNVSGQEDVKSTSSSSSGRQKRLLVKKDSFQSLVKEPTVSRNSSNTNSNLSSGTEQKSKRTSNGDSKSLSEEFAKNNNVSLDENSIKSSSDVNNDSEKNLQSIEDELDKDRFEQESFDSYHTSEGESSIKNQNVEGEKLDGCDSSKLNGGEAEESADSSGSEDSSSTKSYEFSPPSQPNEPSPRELREFNHVIPVLPPLAEEDETNHQDSSSHSGNFTDLYASDGSRPTEINTTKGDEGTNISLKPSLYESDLKQTTSKPENSDEETSTLSLDSL